MLSPFGAFSKFSTPVLRDRINQSLGIYWLSLKRSATNTSIAGRFPIGMFPSDGPFGPLHCRRCIIKE